MTDNLFFLMRRVARDTIINKRNKITHKRATLSLNSHESPAGRGIGGHLSPGGQKLNAVINVSVVA